MGCTLACLVVPTLLGTVILALIIVALICCAAALLFFNETCNRWTEAIMPKDASVRKVLEKIFEKIVIAAFVIFCLYGTWTLGKHVLEQYGYSMCLE